MTVPLQKPGRSRQDYETPPEFIKAVERDFRADFVFDLAASPDNTKAPRWLDEEHNALAQDWKNIDGDCWLNPPFAKLEPWVKKCAESSPARIYVLLPAAVGSNWFRDWVVPYASIYFLNPRLTFVGEASSYPKDLMMATYRVTPSNNSFNVWRWRR